MKKLIDIAGRITLLALALIGLVHLGMPSLPSFAALILPAQTGPSLGDGNTNPYTLALAINNLNQSATTSALTGGTAATKAACTAVTTPIAQFSTVVNTGAVCLPTATAGRLVFIVNSSANTMNLYGSNSPYVGATQDTINGTAGSSAYSVATTEIAQCVAYANGAWQCVSPAP